MRQVLQEVDSGATRLREVPAPVCGPREVLVANRASLISAGTERAVIELAQKSLLGKARERPDQVRRVLEKLRREGILDTIRQVREKLASPIALGYSSAGVVLEVGREVRGFRPGDRVATNGAHAEVVAVSQNLAALIPDGVDFAEAAFTPVAAIALQGVRLANVGLGDRVAVIGLGLIGQIAVQLLVALGCRVLSTDPDAARRELAQGFGAEVADAAELPARIAERTGGQGADAVLLTASTASDEPLALAARVARRKARLVAVGAVGLQVPRREFYPKELELVVSCSYGPGRYDAGYEVQGVDYPYSYVRWTEQRNFEAVLEQIAARRLDVAKLATHRFPIVEADKAYAFLEGNDPYLGVVLLYPEEVSQRTPVVLSPSRPAQAGEIGIGVAGAGNFASLVLIPALARQAGVRRRAIASAGGASAVVRGERHGFEVAVSFPELLADPQVGTVFLLTRHDLHAGMTLEALRAGRNVFVEKPLAISSEQLEELAQGMSALGDRLPLWTVGFNRRFSPPVRQVTDFFSGIPGPKTLAYRFNAGAIPADHWTQDPAVGGGRLIGEACHALDTAAFLLGSPIVRVHTEAVPGSDDQAVLAVRFADGSVASIAYFAGGDPSYPKERIELFGGGRLAVIDDFQTVTLSSGGKAATTKLRTRDKGHEAEIAAFFTALKSGGPPPIPYGQLFNVSRAALAAVESLQTGFPVEVPAS